MPLFGKEQSQVTPANGLLGRDELRRLLDGEIARAARHGRIVSVVIATPRLLKDESLSRNEAANAAEAVAGLLRRSDHAGWLDRSTLLLVLPETDAEQAESAAFRIRTELTRRSAARVINWRADAYTIADEESAEAALTAVDALLHPAA